MKKFILIFVLVFNSIITFSQDTTQKKADTVKYKPLKFILSDYKYSYINQVNPDTVTRRRFLWYPMKNTEDIFNFLPGYYLNYMDVGQLNLVSYNQQYDRSSVGVLRNGRPVNDLYNGKADINLFSRNEIAEIELTNSFGNYMYYYDNAVNIIQRQIFQNRPYTEISFIQDRYENLYFDGDFHQNLFRNLNFNFGITKHSYDGKYVNSDFDKWLGRFNLNFAANDKLNFFAYVNYATIQKGLNEGINSDTVNMGNKEEVFDPLEALVRNSDSYEKKERFDIDIGAVFLAGKSSYTKIQLYETNSFRQYRDEENRLNSNGRFYQLNQHWINYGVKLQQVFKLKFAKKFDIVSRSEGEYRNYIVQTGRFLSTDFTSFYRDDIIRYSFFTDLLVKYEKLAVEGYVKGFSDDNFTSIHYTPGIKGEFFLMQDSVKRMSVFVEYSYRKKYVSSGISFAMGQNRLSAGYYTYRDDRPISYLLTEKVTISGLNALANVRFFKLDLNVNLSANLKLHSDAVPKYYVNADLSFHDAAIKKKLEYKIGVTSKMWTEYKASFYSGPENELYYVPMVQLADITIPQNATLDFFIMGKIGRATFGITMENILNRVIYNTGVYPMIDRGGLANVVSRFNLTWNFFD